MNSVQPSMSSDPQHPHDKVQESRSETIGHVARKHLTQRDSNTESSHRLAPSEIKISRKPYTSSSKEYMMVQLPRLLEKLDSNEMSIVLEIDDEAIRFHIVQYITTHMPEYQKISSPEERIKTLTAVVRHAETILSLMPKELRGADVLPEMNFSMLSSILHFAKHQKISDRMLQEMLPWMMYRKDGAFRMNLEISMLADCADRLLRPDMSDQEKYNIVVAVVNMNVNSNISDSVRKADNEMMNRLERVRFICKQQEDSGHYFSGDEISKLLSG